MVNAEIETGCPEVSAAGVNTRSQANVPFPDTAPVFLGCKWTTEPWMSTTLAVAAMPVPVAYMPMTMPVAEPTVTVSVAVEPVTVVVTEAPAGASATTVPPDVVNRHQVHVCLLYTSDAADE